jgi:hypothetical protein
MSIQKGTVRIATLDEWYLHAPPKRNDQWCDDRSAKECAKAWLVDPAGKMPQEVVTLLQGHPDFGSIESWRAEPEARLRFDKFPGEPRNTDLLVNARDSKGEYLMAVEAKADEPFGETVADALANAVERKIANPRSNGVERIYRLAEALFVKRDKDEPPLRRLRYQLLTATAGAIAEGRRLGLNRIVLLIHEFATIRTTDKKHTENAQALDLFATRLSGARVRSIEPGKLYGPVGVPGGTLFAESPSIYIGKAVRRLR